MEKFRKLLKRKSGRELFEPFKGKFVRSTGSTFISDKDKVIRRNHFAVRLKSSSVNFSRKQATPVKKGQNLPIVFSSSSISPEDNHPLNPATQKTRITAKAVSIPFAHGLRPYCPHQRLCVQIRNHANRCRTLFWMPHYQRHQFYCGSYGLFLHVRKFTPGCA